MPMYTRQDIARNNEPATKDVGALAEVEFSVNFISKHPGDA